GSVSYIIRLWKEFKTLFDMKSELDSDFSFNQVATQIRELRGEKGIAASTLKSFYQRKNEPEEENTRSHPRMD
ncbi:3304_t:CDS:1, partial [Ambispora leptoticha]